MWVMLSNYMFGLVDLHVVRPVEVTKFIAPEPLTRTLSLGTVRGGNLGAPAMLGNPRLALLQVVPMLLVAAAHDLAPVVQEKLTAACAAVPLGLARLDREAPKHV